MNSTGQSKAGPVCGEGWVAALSGASEGLADVTSGPDLKEIRAGATWASVGQGCVVEGEVRSCSFFGKA